MRAATRRRARQRHAPHPPLAHRIKGCELRAVAPPRLHSRLASRVVPTLVAARGAAVVSAHGGAPRLPAHHALDRLAQQRH
eukprot:1229690-Prymnesium_polylepis.1